MDMKAWRSILTQRTGVVALELDTVAGRVALVGGRGGDAADPSSRPGCALEAAGSAACREALAEWVRASGVAGLRCRIALGASFFRCDSTTLPNMSDEELASSARFEAIDRFGLDESQSVIQHIPMGSAAGRRHVALLAARSDQVRQAAEITLAAGLLPESIEHSALTAARGALRWESAMAGEFVSALHIESSIATLSVWRAGSLVAVRTMAGDWNVSPNKVPMQESGALDTIPLEPVAAPCSWRWSALAEETLRALRQSCGESSWPSCLAISGAAAAEPELIRAVGGVCGVPTVAVECGQWGLAGLRCTGPSWASLAGSVVVDSPATQERRAA
jgi:hypothetical protein